LFFRQGKRNMELATVMPFTVSVHLILAGVLRFGSGKTEEPGGDTFVRVERLPFQLDGGLGLLVPVVGFRLEAALLRCALLRGAADSDLRSGGGTVLGTGGGIPP